MSPFTSPSPFMSNRRPEPSPPLTHERGGAQKWHPPFARNGGATGTPPLPSLPSFTHEQDTQMWDKPPPPPPLPFVRKEGAQERGHATRDGVGQGTHTLPPFLPGTRAPCQRQCCGSPPPRLRAEATHKQGADAGVRMSAPTPFAPHPVYMQGQCANGGQKREGVATQDPPPPPSGFACTREKLRRGGRAGHPPSGFACQGKNAKGWPHGTTTLFPRFAHQGKTARGQPRPPGSHQDKNANRRPRRGPPPSPRSARKGET
ncbi:hypothetical protein H4582DRAFT_1966705 [Lactarius indigo]|nr:hypothetical protein H4582DRAFT_1966705 [Lactarius indigo]